MGKAMAESVQQSYKEDETNEGTDRNTQEGRGVGCLALGWTQR
jgi:hypothetical protein